jgi:hypothetical protein
MPIYDLFKWCVEKNPSAIAVLTVLLVIVTFYIYRAIIIKTTILRKLEGNDTLFSKNIIDVERCINEIRRLTTLYHESKNEMLKIEQLLTNLINHKTNDLEHRIHKSFKDSNIEIKGINNKLYDIDKEFSVKLQAITDYIEKISSQIDILMKLYDIHANDATKNRKIIKMK